MKTFRITFGRSRTESCWTDRRALSFDELANLLSESPIGEKDGQCFTPATFSGRARHMDQAVQIDIAVLDSDCGHSLDEIEQEIQLHGWSAIIHSTYSHLSEFIKISANHYDRWLADQQTAGKPGTSAEYLLSKKGYLPTVIEGSTIIDEINDNGTRLYSIKHNPCPKFRIVIPLASPWLAANHVNQRDANQYWAKRIDALAHSLRLSHDQSCTDTSRLFYLPRRKEKQEFLFRVLHGIDCQLWDLPDAPQPVHLEPKQLNHPNSTVHRAAPFHPINANEIFRDYDYGIDLISWASEYARRFEIFEALRFRAPHVLSHRKIRSKKHIKCPNGEHHISSGPDDGTGCFVVNASGIAYAELPEIKSGFYIKCMHNGCAEFDRLDQLRAMIEKGWLRFDDLTDERFLIPAPPSFDPSAILGYDQPAQAELAPDIEPSHRFNLPPYYPAPTEPRDVAIGRQNAAIKSTIAQGATLGAIRRDIKRRRQAAIDNCADWEVLGRCEKAKITGQARRDALENAGLSSPPVPRRTLVTGAQGTGKTATVAACLASVRGNVSIAVHTPTTEKALEFERDYSAAAGPDSLPAMVIRGRGAKDGDTTLCPRFSVVEKAIQKEVDVRGKICATCPKRPIPFNQPGCGYMQQDEMARLISRRGIIISTQHYIFLPVPGDRTKPDLVIVDESVLPNAREVVRVEVRHMRDAVPFRVNNLNAIIEANLTINRVQDALQTPQPLAHLASLCITRDDLRNAQRVLSDAIEEAKEEISGSMPDDVLSKRLDEIPDNISSRIVKLLGAVAKEIHQPRQVLNSVTFVPDFTIKSKDGVAVVPSFFAYFLKRPMNWSAQTSLLVMDGTGTANLIGQIFGALDHIHTPVERNADVTGTIGKSYSRQSLTGHDANGAEMANKVRSARQLLNELRGVAARLPGPRFIATHKATKELFAREGAFTDGDRIAHFGELRGRNEFEHSASGLVIGAVSLSVADIENAARPFLADSPEPFVTFATPIVDKWTKKGWPFDATRGRRMRDGSVSTVDVEVHPDPRVQEVYEQLREAEVIQAVDRTRPVFNRRDLVLANSLCLDITYDRVLTHAELVAGGNRWQLAWRALGVLPLSARDLAEVCDGKWFPSEQAAKHALTRAGINGANAQIEFYLGFGPIYFRYRRAGQRGRASVVAINTAMHLDPRQAIEQLLGPLALFEVIAAQPTAATSEPALAAQEQPQSELIGMASTQPGPTSAREELPLIVIELRTSSGTDLFGSVCIPLNRTPSLPANDGDTISFRFRIKHVA